MIDTVKCMECGGTKVVDTGDNRYRCLYCGATFRIKSEIPETSAQPTAATPQVIIVNQTPVEHQGLSPEEVRRKKQDKAKRDITIHIVVCVFLIFFSVFEFAISDSFLGKLFDNSKTMGYILLALAIINGIIAIYKSIEYKKTYGR